MDDKNQISSTSAPQSMQPQVGGTVTPEPHSGDMASRKRRKILCIVAVIAIVWIGGGAAAFFFMHKKPADPKSSSATINTNFPDASQLTAASLAKLNKTDLFWAYFANQAQQSKLVTTTDETSIEPDGSILERTIHKVGYDYKSKKVVVAEDQLDAKSGAVQFKLRCYNGKDYEFDPTEPAAGWKVNTDAKDFGSRCDPSAFDPYLTEGLNTGGLSAEQTAAFVNALRGLPGAFAVNKAELLTKNGKKYIHFGVTLTPIKQNGSYTDLSVLSTAFNDATSVTPDDYPYDSKHAYGGGVKLEYYVDPSTHLPVYAQVDDTPFKDESGKNAKLVGNIRYQTSYQFGSASFDASTSNNQDLKLGWMP